MTAVSVFEHVSEELEERTSLDRLAARGTVRIGLKKAGLDVESVGPEQMAVVLRKVLPSELESRGIDGGEALCEEMAVSLAGLDFDVAPDRADAAASTIDRMGS